MTTPSRREVYIYYLSLAVCSGSLGLVGLSGLRSSGLGVVPVLLVIGGLGMVGGSVLEVISGTRDASVPDRQLLWLTVGGAALAVGGTVLILLG